MRHLDFFNSPISAEFSAIGAKIDSGELALMTDEQLAAIQQTLTEAKTQFFDLLAAAGEDIEAGWLAIGES